MAVCTYFLRGQCRFGNNCRNEHPADVQQRPGGFGSQTWTNPARNTTPASTDKPQQISLPFSTDIMTNDLTPQIDKPIWPLSSYGPAKHEPTLLVGLDESPEELRLRAVTATLAGNVNAYLSYESEKINAAEQVYANARNNITQAYEQAVKQSSLPALLAASTTSSAPQPTSAFGKSAFTQPSFGQSAFSTTTTTPSVFGQPQQPVSAFSQSSQQQPQSVFGQTQTSSLIKPASGAFGSLNSTPSAFGSDGGGGGFSAFAGQPSAFGAAAPSSAPSAPSQPAPSSVFGQSSFGAPQQQQQQPSAFNAPTSVFGKPPATSAFESGFSPAAGQAAGAGYAFAPGTGGSAFTNPSNAPSASPFAPQSAFASTQPAQSISPFAPAATANPLSGVQSVSAFAPPPQGTSAFPPSSAFPSIQPQPQQQQQQQQLPSAAATHVPLTPAHFAAARTATHAQYRPGATPYDSQLPSGYAEMLPRTAVDAFGGESFEWGGVPEWVPPVEMR